MIGYRLSGISVYCAKSLAGGRSCPRRAGLALPLLPAEGERIQADRLE
ncbi:hypothetical protein [Methylomicrobium album]|nr:hypothetical protein [Methylomicrobium album]